MSLEGMGALGGPAYGGEVLKSSWAAQESQRQVTAPALVQPFGPREDGPPLRTQVQQLLQVVQQQQMQIQELAAALREVRSVVGI